MKVNKQDADKLHNIGSHFEMKLQCRFNCYSAYKWRKKLPRNPRREHSWFVIVMNYKLSVKTIYIQFEPSNTLIATNVCFLGDLRSHDTQTRCEVQDEEDPEAEEEEDDEESTAPLPGSSAEIRVDGALRNLPLAVTVLVWHKEENEKLQENELFQK